MEETNYQQMAYPKQVPYSTAVLVLGILSIVLCWCWGLIGLSLGIIALVLSAKGEKAYQASPPSFTEGSIKNLRAGKVCAIIGTALAGISVLILIAYIMITGFFLGSLMSLAPWLHHF